MVQPRHSVVTAAWVTLNLLPLIAIVLIWLVFDSWRWGLVLLLLYPLCFVPYGFFIAMPFMVKLFRPPSTVYKR
ncbi:MAG: hypothetical protein HYZ72_18000 [Deltaproteobacteria bacterium]|nr:hypothetical protein [Deltaproteobacteria bacterium]